MTSVVAFVFVLGVLIFVHELGHYVAARRVGVRVLTFSLGFGPKLIKYTKGDTEYCISAIPLGGYVKMAGETPDEPRTGSSDEFLSKTKWQRFQVLVMGPLANILLAIVVLALVLYQGADVPAYEQEPPVVGAVLAGSPAAASGIQPGDRVLQVSGRDISTWEQFFVAVMPKAHHEVAMVVERGGQKLDVTVTPAARTSFEMGDIGVRPRAHPQVRGVTPGDPADQAGIQRGDVITALNGEAVPQDVLISRINKSANHPLTLTIKRGDRSLDVVVTPALRGEVGLIGVELSPFELRTVEPSASQALVMSLQRNLESSTLIFRTLWGLVTRETSPKQLMGPVAIAQLSGGAARIGWTALFSLMAMISLNLGILNLLPIPVLDGGHIFILSIEGLARRDFSMKVKEKMLLAGFFVLMLIMVTVIYNDLTRIAWIERLLPWR